MLLLSDKFKELCEGATLYLDTNVFICAREQIELAQLIAELTEQRQTAFVTLNSVVYEYTRGSISLEEFTDRRKFVFEFVSNVLSVNKLMDNERNDAFSVAMSLTVGRKDSQYTDYLLAVALHSFRNGIDRQFILSADARAFPADLFNIEGVVTLLRKGGTVSHLHLISLDADKYAGILKRVSG